MKNDSYFETIYFTDEFDVDDYPQKLCNHIHKTVFTSKSGYLLDIGAGRGQHMLGFARLGHTCTGIDSRPQSIKLDKANIYIEKVNIEIDKLPAHMCGRFDYVWSKSVLEHVWCTDNFVSMTKDALKPGGRFAIMVPDWKSQISHYWDDYTHVKPWTRKGLQNCWKINGFTDVVCHEFVQLPCTWKHPWLRYILTTIGAIIPESLKWKDHEQSNPRKLIRFSKEKMLLVTGVKPR